MKDERPETGLWRPTPYFRYFRRWVETTVTVYEHLGPVLQQQWHIPNSEHYDWRDVPTVREGDE